MFVFITFIWIDGIHKKSYTSSYKNPENLFGMLHLTRKNIQFKKNAMKLERNINTGTKSHLCAVCTATAGLQQSNISCEPTDLFNAPNKRSRD